MKKYALNGVIGLDFDAKKLRDFLADSQGETVEIEINSPGGFVYEGIEIFNMLRRYDGDITTRITGIAASMASYIALAGGQVVVEDNAVFMIHNVWGLAIGDHRELRKAAENQEKLTGLLAQKYIEKTGRSSAEIREKMDEETYFYGKEIKEYGFADFVMDAEPEAEGDHEMAHDSDAQKILAMESVKSCYDKIKKATEAEKDFEAAAAYLKKNNLQVDPKENSIDNNTIEGQERAQPENKQREVSMKLSEFLEKNPEARAEYDQALASAKSEVTKQHAERMQAAKPFMTSQYPEKIQALASKFAQGEISRESLETAVEVYDSIKEQNSESGTTADNVANTAPVAPEQNKKDQPMTDAEIQAMADRDLGRV